MKKDKPLVSIIFVVFNNKELLKRGLKSIAEQKYRNIELIINDDPRSTDNLEGYFNKWGGENPNISCKYIKKNNNLSQGRLEASKHAEGKYILFLDGDMSLAEGLVSHLVKKCERNHFDALYIPEEAIWENFWSHCVWLEKRCYFGDETVSSVRFIKTSAYKGMGGHDPNMDLSEDKDFDIRLHQSGAQTGWSKKYIYDDERRTTLIKEIRRKYFWGQTATNFISKQPKGAVKQGNVLFRPAFIRNWKLLMKHPILTAGMFLMKFMAGISVFASIMVNKIFKKKIIYKHA